MVRTVYNQSRGLVYSESYEAPVFICFTVQQAFQKLSDSSPLLEDFFCQNPLNVCPYLLSPEVKLWV